MEGFSEVRLKAFCNYLFPIFQDIHASQRPVAGYWFNERGVRWFTSMWLCYDTPLNRWAEWQWVYFSISVLLSFLLFSFFCLFKVLVGFSYHCDCCVIKNFIILADFFKHKMGYLTELACWDVQSEQVSCLYSCSC